MERWSGPFANPNLAGLELALLATAAVAIAARESSSRGAAAARLSSGVVAVAAIAGLACTGSRAGGLALAAGLAVLAVLRAMPWRWAVAGLATLTIALLASGSGARLLPDGTDRSINDRFTLWQASLALIADHPLGIGASLPMMLDTWYLPAGMRLRFATTLNDTLTATALWGLPCAGLFAAVLAILLARTSVLANRGSRVAAIAVSLCVVQIATGMFQAHLFAPWGAGRWSGVAILLLLLVTALRPSISWRNSLLAGAIAGLALPAAIAGGSVVWGDSAWRTRWKEGLLVATPRHSPAHGLVVVRYHDEEREGLVADLAPQLHAANLSMALDDENWLPPNPPTEDRLLVLAAGDRGLKLWQDWRNGRLPAGVATAVLDPDGPPEAVGRDSPRGRLLVLPLATNLIPSLPSLRNAVQTDQSYAPNLVVLPSRSWTQAWPAVAAWWSHQRD